MGAQDEQFVFAQIEPVQAVQQPQRVDHFGVVRVAVVGACQVSARIVETVDAQQVHTERRVRAQESGVDGDRPFEQRDRLLVAARDDVEVGDRLEQRAIAGVHFEHALRPRAWNQTLKMVPGREQRHRLQTRARIVGLHDRQQHLPRALHIPDHERQARQHETRARVVRNPFQHGLRKRPGPTVEPARRDLGKPHLRLDVGRVDRQCFLEQRLRVRVLVRFEVEPAPACADMSASLGASATAARNARLAAAQSPRPHSASAWTRGEGSRRSDR